MERAPTGAERPSAAAPSVRLPKALVLPVSAPAGSVDARRVRTIVSAFALGAATAVPLSLAVLSPSFQTIGTNLPTAAIDLGASFVRMLFAYLLSLGFALVYGYFAATNRTGERVLIPILDILQSVPILGFFPVAIVFFVSLTPGSFIGANLASIFLIFTSMSWNMVFGVFESLKSLPTELREAAESFDVHGLQRIRQVLLPATVNRLVYNSVLSWTGGWYFLVAAEFISTSSSTTALPGIGTYLLTAAGRGDAGALVLGFAILVGAISALDLFVWRPLGRWAEKYRYDQTPSGEGEVVVGSKTRTRFVRAAGYVRRGLVTSVSRMTTPFVALATLASPRHPRRPLARAAARQVILGALLVVAWLLLIELVVGVYRGATEPLSTLVRGQIAQVPAALGLSVSRLVIAYAISMSIALPLAIGLARRPRASRFGLPVIEIIASTPATALFPVFVFGLATRITPFLASVLMIMTGMLWYLFFNMLSGVRGIPPDLEEAAKSFGLSGGKYRRRLLFPAIFPSLVTGSITAFGGGWNALVVAEYLQNPRGGSPFQVPGIGQLIDVGNAEAGGLPLMIAALFTMVLAVILVNELLWKPLYRAATEKYRYD